MSKTDSYRHTLRDLEDWTLFLKKESGLPGSRANLELAYTVAEEGNKKQFQQWLSIRAEENTPEVFLVFCGVVGLGKLAARDPELFDQLRPYASDPRWRIREALVTGLQLAADQNMDLVFKVMKTWSKGTCYEKRAAAATLAEPRLLSRAKDAKQALQVLDRVTVSMDGVSEPRDESFKVLRKTMGYCWSVAVAALPEEGKPVMETWLTNQDKNIVQIMKENLKKNRLVRMDAKWVKSCIKKLDKTLRS